MKKTRNLGHAALAVWGALAALGCQNESRSETSASGPMPAASVQPLGARTDDAAKTSAVLRQIRAANQDEIDLGKLAEERAQSAEVKRFAAEMVADHTSAGQKLADLGKRTNLEIQGAPQDPVGAALGAASDDLERSLRGQSGAAFDAAYVAPQEMMHGVVLKLIEEGQKTAGGDAKRVLDELKPTVEMHREHARNLARGLVLSPAAVGGGPAGSAPGVPGHADAGVAPGGKGEGGRSTGASKVKP